MKLLLVDAYSLLYRAFFSSPPFTTKAGEPTGALYGFIRMVLRLLDENQPEFAVVCFDAHGPTFRHDADETYKANRSDAPDDLKIQMQLVRELLDGLSIPRYEHQGFEADDVIGTLAKRGAEDGLNVLIFTGDGDSLQLVSDQTHAYLTKRGVSELDFYDPAAVEARFGFGPKLVPDFKGLKGDTSDNIPGVPGIGDKTASSLLMKFGNLEGVFEHLEEVTPPRIRELLRTHQEQAFHSRTMATIVTDLPVDAEPESFRYDQINPEIRAKAAQTARRFEFKSLVTRYETPAQTAAQTVEVAPNVAAPEVAIQETENAQDVEKWLEDKSLVALSRGEDGLMLAHDDNVLLFTGEIAGLKSWLEDESRAKIAHDAKTLMRGLQTDEIALKGVKADTLLMSYLLEPTRQQHPIPFIAEKFLKYSLPEAPAPKKKTKATLFDDEGPSDEENAQRKTALAGATNVLWHLEPVLRHELAEIGEETLFDELEMPLVPVLAQIECCGMLLEPKQLEELGLKLGSEAQRLEAEIWESAGEKFNIGSPKQLQVILFEKLGLEKGRTIKTGASTDVHTLERLAEKHEIVRKILDYRGVMKLKTTYVDALLTLKTDKNRVHSTLNQTGAVSGRLSSTDPNLQNVPIRTEQGRQIRKAFVAPSGHVLLSADYSQIELRLLAHITGDLPLVEAFQNGEDVHARTAAALFNVEAKNVDKEQRRLAKMTNYAIAYGVSGFGLAKQLGTGTNAGEANEFIKRYFETLPGVKKYIDDTLEIARKQGYVETLLGRRRPLPDIKANAFPVRAGAERTAINHPIQGTAADVMKIAMIAVHKELTDRNLKTCLTMQVHDELVFEVPEDEIEEVKELVSRIMSEVPAKRLGLKVPLVADLGTGQDWDGTKGNEG